jgi:tRNA dimethylallyltransferase
MEPISNDTPLIVILGPTASGKTALALDLAERYNGEIIAADSRTVYKGVDIGTAKPTPEEQRRVPHHLIDVAMPDQQFTAADFQRLAQAAITDIAARGKLPLLVGGSGLYMDAVIYNFSFRGSGPDAKERERLQTLSVEELQAELAARNIPLPENAQNPRHLIRALETNGEAPMRDELRPHTLIIGLDPNREVLRQKITARVDAMVEEDGFIGEVKHLSEKYGWDAPALQAPGYRAFRGYIEGDSSLEEAKQLFVQNDMQYAKRQKTWFKRNPDIHWISKTAESVALVTTLLNK